METIVEERNIAIKSIKLYIESNFKKGYEKWKESANHKLFKEEFLTFNKLSKLLKDFKNEQLNEYGNCQKIKNIKEHIISLKPTCGDLDDSENIKKLENELNPEILKSKRRQSWEEYMRNVGDFFVFIK